MREIQGGEARYRAFVSYSHRDQAFGRRIHRWLERYAVPRRLVGRVTLRGVAPKRVAPVFRDREELSAAHDLTHEIRHALANSGALIVVCSPNAKASPWVTREIELFRELHPDRPVLAALIAGEPGAAFPEALTHARGGLIEPLAADFRREGDGPRLALLKLVAGVIGLGVDELIQRDAQRRLRNVMAVTGAAFASVLAMALLTTLAVTSRVEAERQRAEAERQREVAERQTLEVLRQSAEVRRQRGVALAQEAEANLQRAEAQRQRGEAEDLVEFMLTDLRDRLKGVGRLDVLASVNDRTLDYYAGQDVPRMPPESQMRYARILLAMGEDELSRGEEGRAADKFRAAARLTKRLLAEAPASPERVWAHGQSEYWLGYHAYRKGGREAESSWVRYRELSRTLVTQDPDNARYRRELAYAEGNLCTLALRKPVAVAEALARCAASLDQMKQTISLSPAPQKLSQDLINRHAWMAQAYAAAGNLQGSMQQRQEQERLLEGEIQRDPRNMRLKAVWTVLQRELAGVEVRLGYWDTPKKRVHEAKQEIDRLLRFDPDNADWIAQRARLVTAIEFFEDASNAPKEKAVVSANK
ncbi:MAG: toll/interleukin-1 receptor domain-containing protein [Pseudomonadota bacterium]